MVGFSKNPTYISLFVIGEYMSRQVNSGDPSSGYPSKKDFDATGIISDADLTISSVGNSAKKIAFDVSACPAGTTTLVVSANGVTSGTLQYAAPATGATITVAAASTVLAIEPAGTIALGTIVLPTTPPNGTQVRFGTTAEITGLTLSGGGSDTVVGAITTLAAAAFAAYVYRSSSAKWYRVG